MGQRVRRARKATQDHRDLLGHREWQGQRDQRDQRVRKVHRETPDPKARQVQQELRDQQDLQDQRVHRVRKVKLDHRDRKGRLGLLALQGQTELTAPMALRGTAAAVTHSGCLATQATTTST